MVLNGRTLFLEKYPNLDDDVYRPITDFIESMNLNILAMIFIL